MATPTLSEMFHRVCNRDGQTRVGRTVEIFGWLDLVLGLIILIAPALVELLLSLPAYTVQSENYLRLARLLAGGPGPRCAEHRDALLLRDWARRGPGRPAPRRGPRPALHRRR